jgi:hypothetical protein
LYESYFTETKEKPFAEAVCPFAGWSSEDNLEASMIDQLKRAFVRLRGSERSSHLAGNNFDAVTLAKDVSVHESQLLDQMTAIEQKIEVLLNYTDETTFRQLQAMQASEQKEVLKLHHAIEALLLKSHAPLLNQNPTLTIETLAEIYQLAIAHQALLIDRHQMRAVIGILKEIRNPVSAVEMQRIGELLFQKRLYNPCQYPEILIYAAATGRDPRPSQVKVLIDLFNALSDAIDQNKVEHLLLEFAAGGGKTSVLIPILVKFISRKGKFAVINNTSDLYYQSLQELPTVLQGAFGQQLEVIDRDVMHAWSLEELLALKQKLMNWHKHQNKGLLIKTSSWHSLNSAGKIAFYRATVEKNKQAKECALLISEILSYFKENGVRLEDECHISSDPQQETIRAFENGKLVPMQHHQIYYMAYREASKIYGPESAITQQQMAQVVDRCIERYMRFKPFCKLHWLREYLASPSDNPRTKELVELNHNDPDKADLVILAKACIHQHLPYTYSLTYGKEYGPSIHPGDMTAAPRLEGRPSSAHFIDIMLVSALTIQKAIVMGIPEDDLTMIIKRLREEHESSLLGNECGSLAQLKLQEILNDEAFKFDAISDRELSQSLKAISALHHPWLVKRYLEKHALKQIRFQGRHAKSTPAEMALGFNLSIQFSATPGMAEIYSILLKQNEALLDTEFVVEVLTVLLERNFEGLLMQNRSTPKVFFAEMAKKRPEEFKSLRAFLDRGGLFSSFKPQEVAQAVVEVAAENNLCRHAITWLNDKNIHIQNHTLKGFEEATIAGFTLQQTTGRDYTLGFKARGALFLGKKVALSGIVQAAMRERKLLTPNAQSLFWCVMEEHWRSIDPEGGVFDLNKVLKWSLKNQANEFRSKIVIRAYQGIDAELHSHAWRLVQEGDKRSLKLLENLCPNPATRPWNCYLNDRYLVAASEALESYFQSQMSVLGLDESEISALSSTRIKEIIAQTACLLKSIKAGSIDCLEKLAFQEQEMEEEKEMEAEQEIEVNKFSTASIGKDQRVAAECYGDVDRLESPETMEMLYSQLVVKGIDSRKLPDIMMPHAERLSPRVDWKDAMKPVSHLLMKRNKVEGGGAGRGRKWQYYVLTEAGARFYAKNINHLNEMDNSAIEATLVTIGGTILAATKNICQEVISDELNAMRFRLAVPLLEALAGRSFDAQAFIAALKGLHWSLEDFRAFCQHVRHVAPPGEESSLEKYEEELALVLGW